MAFRISNQIIGSQPIAETSTVQKHPLGLVVDAVDPVYGAGKFIYLKGVANTILGSVATYNADDHSTTLLVADAIGPVGVAMSANVANQYGWYQVFGKAIVDAGDVSDNGRVWASSTAGEVDDATSDGNLVHNAKFASDDANGVAECEIAWPYVDDITTND